MKAANRNRKTTNSKVICQMKVPSSQKREEKVAEDCSKIEKKKQSRANSYSKLMIFWLRDITSIGVARIFDWKGPKSHAMTSSETSKANFLFGQRYRRMEDQKPLPGVGT